MNLKKDMLSWLESTNSQWVFDEIAKIKDRYENKARQLSEDQKNDLTRRLQLLHWGKIGFEKNVSHDSIKLLEGVGLDIAAIDAPDKAMILENTFRLILEKKHKDSDASAVRAHIVAELNACVYYKIKNKTILVIAIFSPEES